MIYRYKEFIPKLSKDCFVAPSADIIGNVFIESGSSVWFNATIRGDSNKIKIGKNVSIQDNCVVHTDSDHPTEISDDVVVGHKALVHGAKVGSNTIIGMGAILLSGSVVGSNCIIGAGSVVTEGTEIPDNSIAIGIPAKVVKQVSEQHIERIKKNVKEYAELNELYLNKHNLEKI
ncbi:gamma carbonic anhydrase family protein [Candidatus Micrarchaeota archaeon]|nr:gamma carbonic anhydrase family protein [Candidatus Micrarchaeota archaeon]